MTVLAGGAAPVRSPDFHDAEGLSIAQINDRVGRAPAMIKAYFDDGPGNGAGGERSHRRGVWRLRCLQVGGHQILPPAGGCAASCRISAASSSLTLTNMNQTTLRATPP